MFKSKLNMFFIFKKEYENQDEENLLNIMYTTDVDITKEWIMLYLTKYLEEFELQDSRESKKKNQSKIFYRIEELNNKFIVSKNYTQVQKGLLSKFWDLFNKKIKERKIICEIRMMKK